MRERGKKWSRRRRRHIVFQRSCPHICLSLSSAPSHGAGAPLSPRLMPPSAPGRPPPRLCARGRRPRPPPPRASPPPRAPHSPDADDPHVAAAASLRARRAALDAEAASLELDAASLPRSTRRAVREALRGGPPLPRPGRGRAAALDDSMLPGGIPRLPSQAERDELVAAMLAALEAGEDLPPDPRALGVTPEPGPAFAARAAASASEYASLAATPGAAELGFRRLRAAAKAAAEDGIGEPVDVVPAPTLPPAVAAASSAARRAALLLRRALVDGDPSSLPRLLVDGGLTTSRFVWRDELAAGTDAGGWVALWRRVANGGATLDPGPAVWVDTTPHGGVATATSPAIPTHATFDVHADAFLNVPAPHWLAGWAGLNGHAWPRPALRWCGPPPRWLLPTPAPHPPPPAPPRPGRHRVLCAGS